MLRVVVGSAVGNFDEQAAGLRDQERQQIMRRYQMRLDAEPQNPQAVLQVELPDRRVPLRWPTFQDFGAPDVIDEHVDAAMFAADTFGQRRDLRGFEVIDGDGDALAAEFSHKLGCLLDCLGPVIVGSRWCIDPPAAATGADHRRTGLAKRGSNAAAGATRRSRHDGDTSAKRPLVRHPTHRDLIFTRRLRPIA